MYVWFCFLYKETYNYYYVFLLVIPAGWRVGMKKYYLIALLMFVGSILLYAGGQGEEKPTDVSTLMGYTSWMKVNREAITGDQTGVLGPAHQGVEGFREIFINKKGERVASGENSYPYPVGTVIVKESYTNNDGMKGDLDSLTVMVKRKTGYDPDNNDWEYIMSSPGWDVAAQGRLEMCIGCHTAASDRDFVFWDSSM